jgi:hypothetical protein
MPKLSDEFAQNTWIRHAGEPTLTLSASGDLCRALLAWSAGQSVLDAVTVHAEKARIASLSDSDARYALIRAFCHSSLLESFDAAQAYFRDALAWEPSADSLSDELAALADMAREDEALDMVDDWQARCGLPESIADDLRAYVADARHMFDR